MARYTPKTPQYPELTRQWAITTPTGVICSLFDDEKLARERFKTAEPKWKLIRITMLKQDVTPEEHTTMLALSKSQIVQVPCHG